MLQDVSNSFYFCTGWCSCSLIGKFRKYQVLICFLVRLTISLLGMLLVFVWIFSINFFVFRKSESSQALKLLPASTDDPSRKHILGAPSSRILNFFFKWCLATQLAFEGKLIELTFPWLRDEAFIYLIQLHPSLGACLFYTVNLQLYF